MTKYIAVAEASSPIRLPRRRGQSSVGGSVKPSAFAAFDDQLEL